jgi:hypothetical protein
MAMVVAEVGSSGGLAPLVEDDHVVEEVAASRRSQSRMTAIREKIATR